MKKIIINCQNLLEREQAHLYLAQKLDFPEYYGKNLDALFDCLTELRECTIILQGEKDLRQAGGYGARILKVLEEASKVNYGLIVESSETEILELMPSEGLKTEILKSMISESSEVEISETLPSESAKMEILETLPTESAEAEI